METMPADRFKKNGRGKPLPAETEGRFSWRNMRLQTRLILLMLVISIPIFFLIVLTLTIQANNFLEQHTNEMLAQRNNALLLKTDTFINMNVSLLNQMAMFDDIISMDPARQKPVLTKTAENFPYIYLAHTLDTAGFNVARNDGQPNKDYSFREYYQGVMKGDPVSYQVVIGATSKKPALIMAAPIKEAGKVVGIISIACELDSINQEVLKAGSIENKDTFTTFVVDSKGYVVAHPDARIANPDPAVVEGGLTKYDTYPPVAALRAGKRGVFEYRDENGQRWLAYLAQMDNGWGVITQQEYQTAFASALQFGWISMTLLIIGAVLLFSLSLIFVRRSLRPLMHLNDTVEAVTAGDLTQEARVERNDEIGQLARAFNAMTAQLQENITNLEQRIQNRTQALTLSTEVSRRLSTILNMDQLTREVVNEIQHAYNYYHVHIYLFNESRQDLVMAGGTGEAGQVMLARRHHIPAGRGLVGRAAEINKAVLVGNTAQDPGWLPNPLLPETKSELAVPISSGDRVLGVLDVQQNVENGLTEADVDLIQLTANQVAIALQNAMTYSKTQQRAEREALVASVGQKIQQAATIDEVLQVAVRELGQALGAQYSSVELHPQAVSPDEITGSREG